MSTPILHIGNKRYSSWSMRPWLALRKAGIAFEENMVVLDLPDTAAKLADLSPGRTVPVLQIEGGNIWDSVAICEWAAEQAPSLWPEDPVLRGRARSAVALMHTGFMDIRTHFSMDLQRPHGPSDTGDAAEANVAAMQSLWHEVKSGDGPFLFGQWSIADAFFTPIATRFQTYEVPLHGDASDYCDRLLADEDYLLWKADADQETYSSFHA